jgi:hypothetical protein
VFSEDWVVVMAIGDVRAERRADWFIDRVAATGSVVLRQIGQDRAGEVAAHRFLSSPYVSAETVSGTLAARTAEQCVGRHIVVIQDTTEISFSGASGKHKGFGPAGNGKDPGFFIHPVIAVDVAHEAVIGLVDVAIWTRAPERAGDRNKRTLAEKESARWLNACNVSAQVLDRCASVTMIADRESDIYELFCQRPAKVHLIVRAGQNRALAGGGFLFDALAEAGPITHQEVKVAPRGPGDKGRTAQVEIKCGRVRIRKPNRLSQKDAGLELTLVDVKERNAPNPKSALCWRLLTTHTVATAGEAAAIVRLYRLRWRIEQTFRALKSDGLRLEESQVTGSNRMFALAAIAMAAAVRTIQLVDARDGSPRPATDVIDADFTTPIAHLSNKLEGKTERQKNPHERGSLAWLAWVVARLGGWNCYYKPPGPKTMHQGWIHLATFLAGFAFAKEFDADV